MYGKIVNGTLVAVSGGLQWIGIRAADGALYPGGLPEGIEGMNVPGAWVNDPEKCAALEIYPVVYTGDHGDPVRFVNGENPPEIVDGQILIERTAVARPDGEVLAVLKPLKRQAVAARFAEICAEGFTYDFGIVTALAEDGTEAAAGNQVLQTRDLEDRTNWMILEGAVNDLLSIGQVSTPVRLRTQSNHLIYLPASEAKTVLVAMKLFGMTKLAQSWDFKNAIEQADTLEAFDAIDIDAAWPA
jgi:hypothetical protein